jgi:hypothetical protein
MTFGQWIVAGMLVASAATMSGAAAGDSALRPPLQVLDIAVGKWEYHGELLATADQKAGTWTWSEDCGWSENRAFVACSFTMHWPDKIVKSLAVNTYNFTDKSYWHYEVFDSDGSGADPFISRMTIEGNTWTNFGHADKKTYRVIYRYASPTEVSVRIELSDDSVHWTTLVRGQGVKQG